MREGDAAVAHRGERCHLGLVGPADRLVPGEEPGPTTMADPLRPAGSVRAVLVEPLRDRITRSSFSNPVRNLSVSHRPVAGELEGVVELLSDLVGGDGYGVHGSPHPAPTVDGGRSGGQVRRVSRTPGMR